MSNSIFVRRSKAPVEFVNPFPVLNYRVVADDNGNVKHEVSSPVAKGLASEFSVVERSLAGRSSSSVSPRLNVDPVDFDKFVESYK